MSKRKEILKQVGVYSMGTQLAQVITLIAAILSRRFLGPVQMGIWTTLQILVDYSKYSVMGTMDAASREIPYWNGKGESQRAEQIKNLAFSFVLTSSLMIAGGIFLFAWFSRGKFSSEITYGLFFVAAIIFLQRMNNLLIALLRCYKKFTLETSMMIWSAAVNAVLVGFLSYFFKIYGFIWALGLSFIFNIVYILTQHHFHFKWDFNRGRLNPLVSYGLPLMFIGIITTVLRSLDKIMLAKFAGFEALGLYSIALMVCSYISNFSISIGIVLLPHFQEKFGVQDNAKDLKGYLFKSSLAYALTMPALIGSVWILAPYGIALFLPKFISGIEAMKLLSLSMFFIALVQPFHDFLITIKKHFFLFPLLAISCALAAVLDYAAIRLGYGIQGVAAATTLVFLFNFTAVYFFACRYVVDAKSAWIQYLTLMGYGLYFMSALFLVYHWMPENIHSFTKKISQSSLFILFYAPLLWILNGQFSLFSLLREKFFTKQVVYENRN